MIMENENSVPDSLALMNGLFVEQLSDQSCCCVSKFDQTIIKYAAGLHFGGDEILIS